MLIEPIAFPDVEELLQLYLTGQFPLYGETASVHTAVPDARPDRFVLCPRVGGVRSSPVVDAATIAFEAWAATYGQAAQLAQLTRALVNALPGRVVAGATFYRVDEFAGPAKLPDPTSAQARYIFTSSIRVRGSAL